MPRARVTDPDTSHEAAASIGSDKLRESQQAVLRVLRDFGPMTDTGLVGIYGSTGEPAQSPSGLRTRRGELVDKGLAVDTGVKVRLPSGRRSILWAAA